MRSVFGGRKVDRTEFGKLVAALRRELRDEQDRSWTQKRLGDETQLGEVIIGKIERGERTKLDSDTLVRLANALQLTSNERKQFFLAAVGIDDHQISRAANEPKDFLADIIQAIERIRLPAFVVDGYGDIVATNSAILQLFGIPPDLMASAFTTPAGFNIMRLIFAPESYFRDIMGHGWPRAAVYNMQFFRSITLRHRFTDYFVQTLAQLRKYPLFRQYWQQLSFVSEDYHSNSERYKYEHPKYGMVDYLANVSTVLTPAGELSLVVYMPLSAKTVEVFASLLDQGSATAVRLASWPGKVVPRE